MDKIIDTSESVDISSTLIIILLLKKPKIKYNIKKTYYNTHPLKRKGLFVIDPV